MGPRALPRNPDQRHRLRSTCAASTRAHPGPASVAGWLRLAAHACGLHTYQTAETPRLRHRLREQSPRPFRPALKMGLGSWSASLQSAMQLHTRAGGAPR